MKSIRVSDLVYFKHQYITTPEITMEYAIVSVSKKLIKALQNEILANIYETDKKQPNQLASIFMNVAKTAKT